MSKNRYSPGQPIIARGAPLNKANVCNSVLETAEDYERRKLGDQGPGRREIRNPSIAKVKNSSGADRRRGELLEFNDFAIDDDQAEQGNLWFIGGNPTIANGFGILKRPIPSDKIDECQVDGICFALVNMVSASHKFASPKVGSYVLESCPAGPVRILNSPGGTGEQGCAILITGDSTQIVVPDQDIAKGATDTCTGQLNGSDNGSGEYTALGAEVFEGLICLAWGGYVFPWECAEDE